MLKIEKGEPWIMWPSYVSDNFINFPSNLIFDYNGNFTFKLDFELTEEVNTKGTLFCKLPTYFGVDIEPKGITIIYNEIDKDTQYIFRNCNWEIGKKYSLKITKNKNFLKFELNNFILFNAILINNLKGDVNSHIIFGAGNFPKNEFNLNYISIKLYSLIIMKDKNVISRHKFKKFIHDKSFDLTDNCNFIHKL